MQAPGEGLLVKLWETVTEKGIGLLLKPWQIRREGRANADVRRDELLTLAQAEQDAELIRSGRLRLLGRGPDARLVPSTAAIVTPSLPSPQVESEAARTAADIANAAATADNLRREVNVSKALLHAEAVLESDDQEPPEKSIDDDWLYRWRDSASGVSAEYLQHLWGRVLAGELKAPGSFSLRTLEFLRNVSQPEAQAVEALAGLVLSGFVCRDNKAVEASGVSFAFLLEMQDLGLLSGVDATGLEITMPSTDSRRFVRLLLGSQRALMLTHSDSAKELKLPVYKVTPLGVEVLSLGAAEPNMAYLKEVGELLCRSGFEVSIGRYFRLAKNQVRFFDATPVCPPAST